MNYYNTYKKLIEEAMKTVDEFKFLEMERSLTSLAKYGIPLLACGNGGSAAITEHMSCDHTKGICMDTKLWSFVIPLQSNVSLITAIANDIGYDEIFSKQIEWWQNANSAVFVVSSSGNSPNIVKALQAARKRGMKTMAMVGFDGGTVVRDNLADICIHVQSDNYGVVEDCHQIIMHALAQAIRIEHSSHNLKL